LFYNKKIRNSYKPSLTNSFIDDEKPLLFLNVNSPESSYGTSFVNRGECDVVVGITRILLQKGYGKDWFGFISPYIGQTNLLSEQLRSIGMDKNIRTIDSW